MPINNNKPLRVRMHLTVELQPYHLKALKHWYGCTTHPQIKRWLQESGTNMLDDLPEKTDAEWEAYNNGSFGKTEGELL